MSAPSPEDNFFSPESDAAPSQTSRFEVARSPSDHTHGTDLAKLSHSDLLKKADSYRLQYSRIRQNYKRMSTELERIRRERNLLREKYEKHTKEKALWENEKRLWEERAKEWSANAEQQEEKETSDAVHEMENMVLKDRVRALEEQLAEKTARESSILLELTTLKAKLNLRTEQHIIGSDSCATNSTIMKDELREQVRDLQDTVDFQQAQNEYLASTVEEQKLQLNDMRRKRHVGFDCPPSEGSKKLRLLESEGFAEGWELTNGTGGGKEVLLPNGMDNSNFWPSEMESAEHRLRDKNEYARLRNDNGTVGQAFGISALPNIAHQVPHYARPLIHPNQVMSPLSRTRSPALPNNLSDYSFPASPSPSAFMFDETAVCRSIPLHEQSCPSTSSRALSRPLSASLITTLQNNMNASRSSVNTPSFGERAAFIAPPDHQASYCSQRPVYATIANLGAALSPGTREISDQHGPTNDQRGFAHRFFR